MDDITPPCQTDEGCLLPPLCATGHRVLELYERMASLADLGAGGKILEMYGATLDDLELLTLVVSLLREEKQDNGDGSEMVVEC